MILVHVHRVALISGSGLAVWILDYLDSGLMAFRFLRQIAMLRGFMANHR